jgi:hypothetical protein
MKIIYTSLIIIAVLLFLYMNIRISMKINVSYLFLNFSMAVTLLKKIYGLDKTVYYSDAVEKIISKDKRTEAEEKYRKYKKYLSLTKYFKKAARAFIIKDILLYPEHFGDSSSFVVQFDVVNRVAKKTLF